jgi:error-prone DNA polymerase
LIVEHVVNLSAELKAVSGLDGPFPLAAGRCDEEPEAIVRPRDMYMPDLHIETIRLKARHFR